MFLTFDQHCCFDQIIRSFKSPATATAVAIAIVTAFARAPASLSAGLATLQTVLADLVATPAKMAHGQVKQQ